MRILAVADTESSLLWDFYKSSYLEDIDLILSAGDLDPDYLSFLVTMGHAPVLYVHGNHDDIYRRRPPGGCINIDGRLIEYEGVRILGLGGSMRYNGGVCQYTESQMRRRVWKLLPPLACKKGFDILLTHAPARGFHDREDLPHRGFEVFNRLIDVWKPSFHIHGHIHQSYGSGFVRQDQRGSTTVINACERCIIDIPVPFRS